MLLDAEKPSPVAPPSDWHWPTQWPALAQVAAVLLPWGFSILARNVHPGWDHVGFGMFTVWALWLSADIAFNTSHPRRQGRSRTRRIVHAMILIVLWLILVIWYFWPFGALRSPYGG